MMVAFRQMSNTIDFSDNHVQVIDIENKELFRKVISAFEKNESDEMFVFSENFTPFEFAEKGLFIDNPINADFNNKKLLSKVIAYMESVTNNDLSEKLAEIRESLLGLADELLLLCEFECEYDFDIKTSGIIKLFQFRIGRESDTKAEALLNFILLCSKYLNINIFTVENLHLYFTDCELEALFDTLSLNHINILSLECNYPQSHIAGETIHILDKDLCEIDNEII